MKTEDKFLSDRLNPVLIKELRQAFRNRMLLMLTGGLLGLQLLLMLLFGIFREEWEKSAEGGLVFLGIDAGLMYLCMFCVCAFGAMQRFGEERLSAELDFSGITLLTPFQIVSGKLASSLVTAFLIAVLCLPFMTVAYFFRNVTLQDIGYVFLTGAVPMLLTIQAALFCGALRGKWAHALFLVFCFQFSGPLLIASFTAGGGASKQLFFWVLQGAGLLGVVLLFGSTVALITPPFANRMFPLRLLTFGIFLLFVPAVLLTIGVRPRHEVRFFCEVLPFVLSGVLALLAVCDRDLPGGRVLAQTPRNPAGRFFHFLLSSNRTGGVICCLLVQGIFAGLLLLAAPANPEGPVGAVAFALAGWLLFYAELAILFHRLLPQLPGIGWLIAVAVLLGVVPVLAVDGVRIRSEDMFISPVALQGFRHGELSDLHLWYGTLLAALPGAWFLWEGVRKFRRWRAPEKSSGPRNSA